MYGKLEFVADLCSHARSTFAKITGGCVHFGLGAWHTDAALFP